MIFRPKSKIQTFFPPKLRGDLQKKKKKKGLRQNSGQFFFQFRKFKRMRGLFLYGGGGAIFHFPQKIDLKSTKNMRFCILHILHKPYFTFHNTSQAKHTSHTYFTSHYWPYSRQTKLEGNICILQRKEKKVSQPETNTQYAYHPLPNYRKKIF